MGGETERSVSGWTTDTLREHMAALIADTKATLEAADVAADVRNEQRFVAQQNAIKDALTAQKEAVAAALVAAEKAVLVAEQNAEKWREAANEWRGAMNDRERILMPRSEAEQRIQAVTEKIDAAIAANAKTIEALKADVDKSAGRREGLMLIFGIIAIVSTIIAVVTFLK